MTLFVNTTVQLATLPAATSWKSPELLGACGEVARRHQITGTHRLTHERGYLLGFMATVTSDLTYEPVIIHYALPARTGNVETDRVHTVSEVLAELALISADNHDHEQAELLRLVGLQDAVAVVAAAAPDIF